MLQNCINGFSEQINTCLQIYMQMVQQLQQGVNASKVFSNAEGVLNNNCDAYFKFKK